MAKKIKSPLVHIDPDLDRSALVAQFLDHFSMNMYEAGPVLEVDHSALSRWKSGNRGVPGTAVMVMQELMRRYPRRADV